MLKSAQLQGDAWVAAGEIAAGDDWFVNWADFPSVVALNDDRFVAHWLELKPEQRYAYDIRFALSDDGGRSWHDAGVLNADAAIAEHGFVSFFPVGDDTGAIWLDGRNIAALTIDELLALEEPVGMALRYARLDAAGRVLERAEVDALVCDCCQTDAVVTSQGPLIVYRDRTTSEVRDITVRRLTPDGWSAGATLGPDDWQIDGCPVNGPALAAAGEAVGVGWFTAAQNEPRIRFTRSSDGGLSFGPALTIAAQGSLGQVDLVVTDDGVAWLSAWHRGETGMELRVHRIGADDSLSSRVAAMSDEPLPVSVPQMALAGDRLVLAWSELGDRDGNPAQVFTVAVPLWDEADVQ